MALLPKKTYSKRNNECSIMCGKGKENVDPFDELLSSPLKQDVQFQPLSHWGKHVKNSKFKQKLGKKKYELFEASDSDGLDSPCQREKKCKSKNSVSKARALQKKVVQGQFERADCNLDIKRDDLSTTYSLINRIKPNRSISINENIMLVPSNVLKNSEKWSLNSTLCYDEKMEESLLSSYNCCSNLKFYNNKKKQDFTEADYISNSNGSINSFLQQFECNKKIIKDSKEFCNNFSSSDSTFIVHEYANSTAEQIGKSNDPEEVIYREDPVNNTFSFDQEMEKTISPFYEDHDSHKFITVKRHFNYPNFFTRIYEHFNNSLKSIKHEMADVSPSQSLTESDYGFNSYNLTVTQCENTHIQEYVGSTSSETYVYKDEDLMDSSLGFNESMDGSLCTISHTIPKSEILRIIPTLECHNENNLSSSIDFSSLSNTEVEDLIQEFLLQQNVDGVADDSSSNTDDTLSEFKDNDSSTKVSLQSEKDDSLTTGSDTEKEINHFSSPSNGVSLLTTGIQDLTISKTTAHELTEVGKLRDSQHYKNCKDEKKDSFLVELRNVTTKRRCHLNDSYEKNVSCAIDQRHNITKTQYEKRSVREPKFEQTRQLSRKTDRNSVDCDKSVFLPNPLFESTRLVDIGFADGKILQKQTNVMDDTTLDSKFTLKPGKKWLRSISVLKQLQDRSLIEERFESTKITGRKFESFLQDIIEMQNDQSGFFSFSTDSKITDKTCEDSNVKNSFFTRLSGNKTFLESESMRENELKTSGYLTASDSVFSRSVSNTVLEKSVLNHTVKIIDFKEGPSYFKSALGLANDRSSILDDSNKNDCSAISAKDFILMQCGQDCVLSFEEYFNERTLKSCKKIGEGVYGEVFMSCDSVIKIIPIEGSEKVNGEPQKTFEEIISEVVIASKLSDLRKEEMFRTDGFSELKRCWCVKGKYPKYLLDLWNEYDQSGNGSENDSPVMFKDDQLYIILELANGGKDLESFVFSSSAQSLSIFIQAAFSLAAAEKACGFEHRDLHWGNVLISETQKKFTSVVLNGKEYKIPTKGVQICIIDFTLSRINHEGCCIFNDLSVDPSLFASDGDYQFEIYRMMLKEVENDWSLFRPKTNLFWLHYLLDKMIKMVRYKNKKAKVHLKHLKDLKTLESVVLEFNDSTEFVLNESFSNVLNKF